MTPQEDYQGRREPVAKPAGEAPRGGSRWRRWSIVVGAAVCVAVVVVCVIGFFFPGEDEIDRVQATVAEMASQATPDIAQLHHEAGDVATKLLDRFPYNADALAVIAGHYERLGRVEDSVRCWQECIQMDPSLASVCHEAIAKIALDKGEQEKASFHFRKAMEQAPASSTYPVQLAEVLVNQGKLQEAVSLLEENRKVHPGSMPASVLLGQAYLQLGEHEKAKHCLEMAIELGPDFTNAYYGLSRACAQLGDQEKSKEYLDKFKALQAKDEQRHRDALKTLDDTAKFRQAVAQVHTGAAHIYVGHGEVRTAEEHLLRAAELAPRGAACRTLLACLYEKQGRTEEALQTLAELSEVAPNDLNAQLSIAAVYARLGQFYEAEAAYRKAIELTPHQAGGYAALAHLYLQAGRKLPEAKTLAVKAVLMEPAANHYFVLSLACLKTGDRAAALSAIEQAVALDGDNTQYRSLQQSMQKKE